MERYIFILGILVWNFLLVFTPQTVNIFGSQLIDLKFVEEKMLKSSQSPPYLQLCFWIYEDSALLSFLAEAHEAAHCSVSPESLKHRAQ